MLLIHLDIPHALTSGGMASVALLHKSYYLLSTLSVFFYMMVANMLYSDAFRINSLAMFGNFLAATCSPNVLLMDEKTVSLCHPSVSIAYATLP
jgi:hypothetical protein